MCYKRWALRLVILLVSFTSLEKLDDREKSYGDE